MQYCMTYIKCIGAFGGSMRRGIVTLITYIQSDHIDQIRWASGGSIKRKNIRLRRRVEVLMKCL